MKLLVLLLTVLPYISGNIETGESALETFPNITGTFIFTNIADESVLTVDSNGVVSTQLPNNSPEQKWTIGPHPSVPGALEFKQEVVPYNELSGYENNPDHKSHMYPTPMGLAHCPTPKMEEFTIWSIVVREKWCVVAQGDGVLIDTPPCDVEWAPEEQCWKMQQVS